MKTIKNLKDITTLEVGDAVIFDDLTYRVIKSTYSGKYYLHINEKLCNDEIFKILDKNKRDFVEKLGIDANCNYDFPETKSLEALTAIVSALFKEYEKQNELPKTWEEFCQKTPIQEREHIIGAFSSILEISPSIGKNREVYTDKNLCTSKHEARAFLALMQLRQLRKAYVKDWEPDWKNYDMRKYIITFNCDNVHITAKTTGSHPMSFPTYELAEQFLTNFKDLLEVAKPLL